MIGSKKYKLTKIGQNIYSEIKNKIDNSKYSMITNPCGEINLKSYGGYCLISDIVPYFTESKQEIKDIISHAIRFLIRANLMDAIYSEETKRTNRIGISMTGIHEYAWKEFGYGFYDLIDENKSKDFWNTIEEFRIHAENEASNYSKKIGVNIPHTVTTIKPSGSISKLYALTEGAHLPAMRYYIRWVQKQNNDPLIENYKQKGYPVISLKTYPNVSIVGFPTVPLIARLGMGDKLITAAEASIEDQYKWLQLLEKYWIGPLGSNGQVSFTLKYDPSKTSREEFKKYLIEYQSQVRCCSVMPVVGQHKQKVLYEYLPEEEVTESEFMKIMRNIKDDELHQEIDIETLFCSSGSCPI